MILGFHLVLPDSFLALVQRRWCFGCQIEPFHVSVQISCNIPDSSLEAGIYKYLCFEFQYNFNIF